MKIEDYIHFYIGCLCQTTDGEITGRLLAVRIMNGCENAFIECGQPNLLPIQMNEIKLILRQLGSMTDEEKTQAEQVWYSIDGDSWMQDAARTRFLLSKSFDLFNLIPSGLALDATKLTTHVK